VQEVDHFASFNDDDQNGRLFYLRYPHTQVRRRTRLHCNR